MLTNHVLSSNFSLAHSPMNLKTQNFDFYLWFLRVLSITSILVISAFSSLAIFLTRPTTYVEAALCFCWSSLISLKIQSNFDCHHWKAFNDCNSSPWLKSLILRLNLWIKVDRISKHHVYFVGKLIHNHVEVVLYLLIVVPQGSFCIFLFSELSLWNFEIRAKY